MGFNLALVQETEEPKWNVVGASDFKVVTGEHGAFGGFLPLQLVTDTDVVLVVDEEESGAFSPFHIVVAPETIDEIGFVKVLLFQIRHVERVHQVGVVQLDGGWLFRETVTDVVNHIDEAAFFKILQVVHHSGARRTDVIGQAADVG